MIDLKQLNHTDPLKRMVEKVSGEEAFSPMDPPDAFSPPVLDKVPYEEMHPCLRRFVEEHARITNALDQFEKDLLLFKGEGWKLNRGLDKKFSAFFSFMDETVTAHHLREEKVLFPVLQEQLLSDRQQRAGVYQRTAIDVLEADHITMKQHLALLFNLLALAYRLPDPTSRALTLDVAAEQGFALIELMRLHIFREENIAFPQSHRLINVDAFDVMLNKLERYANY